MQQIDASPGSTVRRGPDHARAALVGAAMRLLPERAPSTITGRDLASEAGVNYGLVHHYFGSKDVVLEQGMRTLRDDFVQVHGDVTLLRLMTDGGHPYLRALVRSQVDYPDSVAIGPDFPIPTALVEAVTERLAGSADTNRSAASSEAKARVIAMISIQICYSVFGEALLAGTGVEPGERPEVERSLGGLYDALALSDRPTTDV